MSAAAQQIDVTGAEKLADQRIGEARLLVRKRAPYFRRFLVRLVFRPDPAAPTLGVSKNLIVRYNPVFIAQNPSARVAGFIAHEILHVMNKHCERRGSRDGGRFNRAGDLAINPTVREMGFEFDAAEKEFLWPKNYGFKEGLTADEYYRLLEEKEEDEGGGEGEDGEDGEDGEPGDGKPGKNKPGNGHCGGCAGNPDEVGEPGDDDAEGRSADQIERTIKEVAEAIRTESSGPSGQGMPAMLKRLADEILSPAKVDWRQKLARAIRAGITYRAGAALTTFRKRSRHQAGIGYGDGLPMLHATHSPRPIVVAGIDTSGSMGPKDLAVAAREVGGVLKAAGAACTFMTNDAAVHTVKKVRTVEEVCKLLDGGGSTDFRPFFAYVDKMPKRDRPEVCVFLSDCDGPFPAAPPKGIRCIIVRTGTYKGNFPKWPGVDMIDVDN